MLFQAWQVKLYEQEGDSYMLHISATLIDDSRLEIRDYLFVDGHRKYAYQWMEIDGQLRRRWDNAPHWLDIATSPHHVHLPNKEIPEISLITNIEDLLIFIQSWFANDKQAYSQGCSKESTPKKISSW
jgi:hypothetical protein